MYKPLLVFSTLILFSCNNSPLGKKFDASRYDIDSRIIQEKKDIPGFDKFLLNYAILRHRDHFNYEIEGKTFEEILTLARELMDKGMDIEEVFNKNGEEDHLKMETQIEGTGVVRKTPDSKKMIKVMKFSCKFTNVSDTDIALLSSTFQLEGPFKKFITAAGYDINCLIRAGESLKADFILDARNIQQNLEFNQKVETPYLYLDEIIANSTIIPSGNTVITDLEFYEKCDFKGERLSPFKVYDFYKDFDPATQIIKDENGKAIRIDYGDAHFQIEDNEQPIDFIPAK